MKRFAPLLLLAALLVPLVAFAATTRTFQNVPIGAGTYYTPDIAVPKGSTFADVIMSRDSWPLAGATIAIEFTYNGSTWTTVAGPTFVAAAGVNPKTGQIDPAGIGFGWQRNPQPLRARIRADAPSFFTTDITVKTR